MDAQYGESQRVTLSGPIPQPWNIYNFYAAPAKNDPWIPPGVITPAPNDQPGHHAHLARQHVQNNFLDYRSTASPSDCATLTGDSGYGSSRPTYSIASASAHGDDAALDSQMGHVMGECQIDAEAAFEPRQHQNKYRCEDCNALLKSQGELKKHRQRHLKPHLCPHRGCPKAHRGFSTSNDLVRHKRSVHGEHDLPGRSFICHHCRRGEKPPKIWPRADNFRSHLLRAHQMTLHFDDDHKDYLYRPSDHLEGVGTSVGFFDPQTPGCPQESPEDHSMDSQFREDQFENHGQMGINPALFQRSPAEVGQRQPTRASEEDRYVHPVVLGSAREPEDYGVQHGQGYSVNARGYSHGRLPEDGGGGDAGRCLSASPGHVELTGEPPMENQESWTPAGSGSSESTQPGLDDLSADMANLQQCQGRPDDSMILDLISDTPGMNSNPSEIVNYLKRFPREFLQTALGGGGQDTEGGSQGDDEFGQRAHFDCEEPHCGKAFNRQCELKKHKKRHDKPYGCTFKSCSKRFGSKNDWKRHESSQHFQLESWNCNEPDCKKTYQRRESFKNHLQKDHGMGDADAVDEKLEACRLGRHCDPRFWCGFCIRVIEIDVNERGGNSWTKRCDHIDNHLFGKDGLESKFIRDWKHQDDEQAAPASTSTGVVCDASGEVPLTRAPLNEVESNGRKRRGSADANTRPRKRAAQTQAYMWTCCMCSTTMNLKTSSCCFECHHQRCTPNCAVEYVANYDEASGEEETRPTDTGTGLDEAGYDL
ncbi:Sex-determining transformer protein 1 [Tolypocladium ophioglossoides CBS 100239]|uniref:Sex-determining transformer protein 1 n=1 Tax=Tolypocladium ophioglossoides (strain CBS 100239) TaxID=1163406 RepID=A0A0L0N6G7_TOLOC|nr:Sex-determining transformer protein 1 [Tolypocladium ophioglossoides CBS 100239]